MDRELLTQTKIADFKQCRRMFFHRHEQHLESRVSRPGRRRGHAFGVAIWAALEWEGEGFEEDAYRDAITEAYADLSPSSQQEADDMEFEQHALQCLVPAYLQRYPVRQRRELEYRLPLLNPDKARARSRTFDRAGKLDGLEIVTNGQCRLIEDKLTAQITAPRISALSMDMQTCEYVDALLARGWQTVEVLYRMTRWPSIRRKQGETSGQFMTRFSEDLQERLDWYFVETKVVFPTDRLAEHRRMRWQVGKDILQARRTGTFYQNESRCVSRDFGECEYLPICSGRDGALDLYVTREANPELDGRNNGDTDTA